LKWTDPIVDEVRKVREELWEESGRDFDRLCDRLMEQQRDHMERICSRDRIEILKGSS